MAWDIPCFHQTIAMSSTAGNGTYQNGLYGVTISPNKFWMYIKQEQEPAPTSSPSVPALCFSTVLYIIGRPSWRSFYAYSKKTSQKWCYLE
ncbi:MAG: hypothetical protein IJ834_07520, partial [Paludibacteraceae bacterium]|nr:hypothetical protein [Paludibacteraceae bacterium]